MRHLAAVLAAIILCSPVHAAPQPAAISTDGVLRWIGDYRYKPDPMRAASMIRALSASGALKNPESAAVYVGFLAGVIGGAPDDAEKVIRKTLPLPFEDQWVVIRAIAYSGHPHWKSLLHEFAMNMPGRQVLIHKFLDDKLPTLDQIAFDRPMNWRQKVKVYFTGKEPDEGKLKLEPAPEIVDMLWGYYFATGAYRPVVQIVGMLHWSTDKNSLDKLTVGSMAKYTLATNAARDGDLLKILRWQIKQIKDTDKPVLAEVIDAAETVDTVKLRKMALAAIDERKAKGPGYKQNVATWGQVGQAAIGLGCIAAAATGQVEFGLPCVIGGAASTAALNAWAKQ